MHALLFPVDKFLVRGEYFPIKNLHAPIPFLVN